MNPCWQRGSEESDSRLLKSLKHLPTSLAFIIFFKILRFFTNNSKTCIFLFPHILSWGGGVLIFDAESETDKISKSHNLDGVGGGGGVVS